jgi:hypothetical protein
MRFQVRSVLVGLVVLFGSACGDPEIIVPELLAVDILPSHGAVEISVDVEALAIFSHDVADTATAAQAISLECLGSPPCASPTSPGGCPATSATVTFESNNKVARVAPNAQLARNTCYAIVIAQGVEAQDANVGPLPADIRSSFYTER